METKPNEITSGNYVKNVLRTESSDFEKIGERLKDPQMLRLLHAAMGFSTESGEFVDSLKKHIFYGKELDKSNLIYELGDIMWYLGIAMDMLGVTMDEVMALNIDKLKKRYPNKFEEAQAINRTEDNNEEKIK